MASSPQQLQHRMIIVFRRTGQRRYGMEVRRTGFPDLERDSAPGYDRLVPHDLMHLVVEAQLGLTRGIFGQLAAGGNAGTFELLKSEESSRARKRAKTRAKNLLKQGRDECLQSERATYICWQEWLARSASPENRERSKTMAQQAKQVRGVAGAGELRSLNPRKLDEICKHLDELSSHWSRLEVGQSMAVAWPGLAIVSD